MYEKTYATSQETVMISWGDWGETRGLGQMFRPWHLALPVRRVFDPPEHNAKRLNFPKMSKTARIHFLCSDKADDEVAHEVHGFSAASSLRETASDWLIRDRGVLGIRRGLALSLRLCGTRAFRPSSVSSSSSSSSSPHPLPPRCLGHPKPATTFIRVPNLIFSVNSSSRSSSLHQQPAPSQAVP